MDHRGLLTEATERGVASGASYVEARYGRAKRETLGLSDGAVASSSSELDQGVGIRMLVNGFWGFAASDDLDRGSIADLVDQARAIAGSAATSGAEQAELAGHDPIRDDIFEIGEVDPETVSHAERIETLQAVHQTMAAVPGVAATKSLMDIHRETMELVTSEGTEITQTWGIVGGGYIAVAEGNGTRARRSFPHHDGKDYASAGMEWFQSDWFSGNAERIAKESVLLLDAGPCPTATTTVVMDPAMIGTTLHETVGHATELDRIIGDERDNFGGSFVTTDRIGSFQYGSALVNVTADATLPGGAGSYAYDAEGVPSQRVPLIKNGILVNALNSRECASIVDQPSNGTARASSWNRIPMARMTNVALEPGLDTFESLIAGVDDGIYISTDAMTDIDDNRELCSFGGEIGWRIRSGQLAEPIARPFVYTDTHGILGSCDGIGSAKESVVTGILGCGKGQPWQFIFTGQGGPPARFRNVSVGPPGR